MQGGPGGYDALRRVEPTMLMRTNPRLSLSRTVIGSIGGRLKGRFSATPVRADGDGPAMLMTDGVFDVRRHRN